MGDYEDFVQRLKDEGLDDLAGDAERFSNQEMRKRIGRTAELERENEDLKIKVRGLEDSPKRDAALRAAKVDIGSLRPAEVEAISRETADEYGEEWAKKLVEKYQLPVTSQEESGEEVGDAKEFGVPGGPNNVGGRAPKAAGSLKASDVASWKPEKRMAFREWCDKNGKEDVWEALLQGQDVTGVTFQG